MTRVTSGKSRVRESRLPGSVRAEPNGRATPTTAAVSFDGNSGTSHLRKLLLKAVLPHSAFINDIVVERHLLKHDASADWSRYAEDNPYFGVLSNPKYIGRSLNAEARNEFFASGHMHAEQLLNVLRETFGEVQKGIALDFGCGVGRITQGLASHFKNVVGLDVAPGMLAEARRNAQTDHVDNVEYNSSLDSHQLKARSYDLVHSYIVLQHIPVKVGEPIIAKLIECVREGGIGALHMTIPPPSNAWRTVARNTVKRTKILRFAANILLNRRWNASAMEMNLYKPERVVEMLAKSGIERFSCIHVDDWGSIGLFFLFRRDKETRSPWSNPVRVKAKDVARH